MAKFELHLIDLNKVRRSRSQSVTFDMKIAKAKVDLASCDESRCSSNRYSSSSSSRFELKCNN